jgi:hypothetical protein
VDFPFEENQDRFSRPWWFDLDATHSGRSNTYSFVYKGVHHVLKPMLESAINAGVFATSKVKKNVAGVTSKLCFKRERIM